MLQKNTQHKATNWTQSTRIEKNKNQFNLSSCLLWFLGGFVFEDSFAKKNEDLTCNTIAVQLKKNLTQIRLNFFLQFKILLIYEKLWKESSKSLAGKIKVDFLGIKKGRC